MKIWGEGFPVLGLLAWLCCLSLGPVQGGKVLVVPVDGSHWLSMKILVKELVRRGHEVIVLAPESSRTIHDSESYRTEVYPVPYTKADLDVIFDNQEIFLKPPKISDLLINVQRLMNYTSLQVRGCDSLLSNEPLMSRLQGSGLDLVLTDPFLPCGSILSHVFSIPAVYFMNVLPCQLDSRANRCPTPLSYVPLFFSENTDSMSFPQRLRNMLMYFVESYLCRVLYVHFDELVGRHLGADLTYRDLLSHASIWLLRYDFVFQWPKPVMPNMAFIGGINCAKKSPLPADLQEFVDSSGDDGFIVFTLGSVVSSMPQEKAQVFLEAFRQIPQKVVWRYTGVLPDNVPDNVRLMKWLPQNDLLAHPQVKAFITHGGSHGIYEGICNAVPMVMFPLFGDQRDNVLRMVARGVAEKLSIYEVTTESLLAALNKIIHDRSYKENIMKLSQIHLDRPVHPLDLAVFWTEFVIRHKGAAHLKVSAHDLNWVQYHSLDVIGFFAIVLLTVLWVTLRCCLFCTRRCYRKTTEKRKSE